MRDSIIDIVKGVGIFLVVLGHFTTFASPLYQYIYLFHMPLFFFLSGMFFKPTSLKTFLIRKSKRLLLPYLFYWVVCRGIMCFNHIVMFRDYSLNGINFNLFFGGALWFLISLWSIHTVCTIAAKCKKWKYLIYAILILIGLTMGYKEIRLPLYLSQTMLMLPFFLIGKACYTKQMIKGQTVYQYIINRNMSSLLFIIALILFLIPCDFLDINGPIIPNPIQYILTPLSGIVLTLMLCKQGKRLLTTIKIDKIGVSSLHILGAHFELIPLMWFVIIPILIRIGSAGSVMLTGSDIKNCILIQLILSSILTYISFVIGSFFERIFPKLFK